MKPYTFSLTAASVDSNNLDANSALLQTSTHIMVRIQAAFAIPRAYLLWLISRYCNCDKIGK